MTVANTKAPRVSASPHSLAATAAALLSSPLSRLRASVSSLAAHARELWAEIEPGFHFDRRNTIERWDGRGEGRAWNLAFEGLGFTWQLFIGRTPRAMVSGDEAAA